MRTLVLAAAALAIATPAAALSTCTPTSSPAQAQLESFGRTVYYVADNCSGSCLYAEFVYTETNGLAGLQRHDFARDDTCGGAIAGDTETF